MKKLIVLINNGEKLEEVGVSVKGKYDVLDCTNVDDAIKVCSSLLPSVIIVNCTRAVLEKMKDIDFIEKLIKNTNVPIVAITDLNEDKLEIKLFENKIEDCMKLPINPILLLKRIDRIIELSVYKNELEALALKKTSQVQRLQDVITKSMAELVECRDVTTGGHVKRTAQYVRVIVNKMKQRKMYSDILTDSYIKNLIRSAPLHDIGKIGIKDNVLLKAGSLTDTEFEYMKLHTTLGEQAINKMINDMGENSFLLMAKDVAATHHEAWNGSGYPRGLKTEEIPLSGRIMAIADIYDALTTKRPYKKTFTHDEAVELIKSESGKKLDPIVVNVFLDVEDMFKMLAEIK